MWHFLKDSSEHSNLKWISYLLKNGSISLERAEMYALGGVKKEPVKSKVSRKLTNMYADIFLICPEEHGGCCVRYPGSWPLRRNRGQWCKRRSQPRGAVPGLCHNWGTPLPFLSGTEEKCQQDFVTWEPFRGMFLCLLTNLWWLEGALLQLFLQLCQRGVGDHFLKPKS